MFGSGYENCPEFGVLGGVIFKLDNRKKNYCSSGAFQVAPASYYCIMRMADYHIVLIEQGKQSYGFEKKGSKSRFVL